MPEQQDVHFEARQRTVGQEIDENRKQPEDS